MTEPVASKSRARLIAAAAAGALLIAGGAAWMLRSPDPSSGTAPTATAAPQGTAEAPAPAVAYDPTKLLENGVAATEVYTEEPRTESWAEVVETGIGYAMGRDLHAMVPEAAIVLKCKTLSCLVGIDAPAEKREAALAVSKLVTLGPWVVDLDTEDDGTLRWLFFAEPRFADARAFVSWYEGVRKTRLADIRAGKGPNPLPVAVDKVPLE